MGAKESCLRQTDRRLPQQVLLVCGAQERGIHPSVYGYRRDSHRCRNVCLCGYPPKSPGRNTLPRCRCCSTAWSCDAVGCPHNNADINKLKAYKNIGNAYIDAGGNIADIQKLYVENGGEFDGNIS